jgi:ribose/xylose/arabinose/galactoside ABC-type transport system permease subunit
VIIALVVGVTYLSITQPVFMTWGNITNIVASNTVVLVLAVGATFVIISGGIDMSAAAATTACSMVLGQAVAHGAPAPIVIIAPIVFGLLVGLVNGVLISLAKISFLVVTLGMMSILTSLALVTNNGRTISVFGQDSFSPVYTFATGRAGSVPYLLIFDVALALVAAGLLRFTAFGRALFAIGSNREAARLNGINVAALLVGVYAIAGLSMGLASVVQVGRLTGASPTVEPDLLLTVITAVLIGGTAYTGGEGGVLGTVIGVLFLGAIQNGLTLSDVSSFWKGAVNGAILILAVGLTVLRDRGVLTRWRLLFLHRAAPVG